FVYPADKDSVLLVNQDDYNNCNTDHPLQKYDGGHTVYTFEKSGPHYFISGTNDNCQKNEKVVVVVLAERGNRTDSSAPTPSPSADTPPSPAPASQGFPSPPSPSGTVEINPVPAPFSEPPPPSGAASVHMSLLGCIGALVAASSLVF
ncbi:early nodulin-like protein 3, partial [Morus notabilis]|uniref:early nodulin-like protein 3 n=1 Tax=Morus notabilis TaxID=981085 RepID=UPI000CECF6E7